MPYGKDENPRSRTASEQFGTRRPQPHGAIHGLESRLGFQKSLRRPDEHLRAGTPATGENQAVRRNDRFCGEMGLDTLTPEEQNQYHDAMVSEYEKLVISEAYEQIGLKKGREEGRAEGLVEGMEKGMEQGKMEVARQMKKMGLSIAQIVQASGLLEEVVKGL